MTLKKEFFFFIKFFLQQKLAPWIWQILATVIMVSLPHLRIGRLRKSHGGAQAPPSWSRTATGSLHHLLHASKIGAGSQTKLNLKGKLIRISKLGRICFVIAAALDQWRKGWRGGSWTRRRGTLLFLCAFLFTTPLPFWIRTILGAIYKNIYI